MKKAVQCLLLSALCAVSYADYPFRNTSLGFEERVKDLIGRLSLEEKIAQMSHGGADKNSPTPAIQRLGIGPYQFGTECLRGDVGAGNATAFPPSFGTSSCFRGRPSISRCRSYKRGSKSKEQFLPEPL